MCLKSLISPVDYETQKKKLYDKYMEDPNWVNNLGYVTEAWNTLNNSVPFRDICLVRRIASNLVTPRFWKTNKAALKIVLHKHFVVLLEHRLKTKILASKKLDVQRYYEIHARQDIKKVLSVLGHYDEKEAGYYWQISYDEIQLLTLPEIRMKFRTRIKNWGLLSHYYRVSGRTPDFENHLDAPFFIKMHHFVEMYPNTRVRLDSDYGPDYNLSSITNYVHQALCGYYLSSYYKCRDPEIVNKFMDYFKEDIIYTFVLRTCSKLI